MEKIFFLLLIFSQVFPYKYETEYNYAINLINNIDFNEDFSFIHDNNVYDYSVIRGEIKQCHTIYFNISSPNQIDPYYYFSNEKLTSNEISNIIDNFDAPSVAVKKKGGNNYYTFSAKYSGSYKTYCYLAIHSEDSGKLYVEVHSSYSTGSWLRSHWKRLAYFFLICLIVAY